MISKLSVLRVLEFTYKIGHFLTDETVLLPLSVRMNCAKIP